MLLKKLARIFIGLALFSLQAANCQSLVETVGQFIPPSTSSVDGKSIKSAIEAGFLINFFENLDSETFDSTNPEISKAAKKISNRAATTIAKGLKNIDLELSTKEKLFICNQLKFMTTLLLRINGLSDQCKQDILKTHRLINAIFNPSFSSRAFDFIYAQKNKAFTVLGLITATFGTLAAFHAFKILKNTDHTTQNFTKISQDLKQISGLCASACQTASDHPENLAAGLGAGIDVLAAKQEEITNILTAIINAAHTANPPPPASSPQPPLTAQEMIDIQQAKDASTQRLIQAILADPEVKKVVAGCNPSWLETLLLQSLNDERSAIGVKLGQMLNVGGPGLAAIIAAWKGTTPSSSSRPQPNTSRPGGSASSSRPQSSESNQHSQPSPPFTTESFPGMGGMGPEVGSSSTHNSSSSSSSGNSGNTESS